MSKKYMVVGANGALGSDLMRVLEHAVGMTRGDMDLCNPEQVSKVIGESDVDGVINTAAFHDVPLCEKRREEAFAVNAAAVTHLAKICHENGKHLCHISTDYVFDGQKHAPYTEEDLPRPLNVYAASKLAGEYLVAAYCPNSSIVRSCGLYGRVPTRVKGSNFVTTMIRLGRERDLVSVVDDEMLTPTYTYDLALGLRDLLEAGGRGLFHLTQTGATSWYAFASVVFEHYGLPAKLVPTKAAAFQTAVKRPGYSVLDNGKFNALTGKPLPTWDDALKRHLDQDDPAGKAGGKKKR